MNRRAVRHVSHVRVGLVGLVGLSCLAASALAVHGCTVDQGNGGCVGFIPMDTEVPIPADRACAIAQEGHVSKATTELTELTGNTCNATCGSLSYCSLPGDYLSAYVTAQSGAAEASIPSGDASPPAGGIDGGDGASEADSSSPPEGSDSDARVGCPPLAPPAYFQLTCTSACGQ